MNKEMYDYFMYQCECQEFAEAVIDIIGGSFIETPKQKFDKIFNLLDDRKKYPKLILRYDQNVGNFS